MKITLKKLQSESVDKLVIESVDLSLYIAHAVIGEQRMLIADKQGKPLKTRNLLEMKSALAAVNARKRVLTQRSAYDEMVGHSHAMSENHLEISLAPGFEALPGWQH